jgi:hypothetical protein
MNWRRVRSDQESYCGPSGRCALAAATASASADRAQWNRTQGQPVRHGAVRRVGRQVGPSHRWPGALNPNHRELMSMLDSPWECGYQGLPRPALSTTAHSSHCCWPGVCLRGTPPAPGLRPHHLAWAVRRADLTTHCRSSTSYNRSRTRPRRVTHVCPSGSTCQTSHTRSVITAVRWDHTPDPGRSRAHLALCSCIPLRRTPSSPPGRARSRTYWPR